MRATVRLLTRLGLKIQRPRSQRHIRSSAPTNKFRADSENASALDLTLIGGSSRSKHKASSSKEGRSYGLSGVCPERKLAAAVFCQAANDLQTFRYERRETGCSLYADARNWIASNDRSWPYSFLNLCDALHLEADLVRVELLGDTSRHPSLSSWTNMAALPSRNNGSIERTGARRLGS